ncbi:SO2930 family diheme c-type cytochrome [Pinirhizobacter sp.]|jgi:uncharacterized repeat protein (TIGR03806 family)|uniref:SO2930 family diheme c-type cytochrome n=1 Tax=Pinirhizobacter sp. TaxID=2950432 RepID=UPI002F3F9C82
MHRKFSGCVATVLLLVLCGMISACHRQMPPVTFHAEGRPALLSEWHVVAVVDGKLVLNQGVVPYDLTTPLFTDYAHKLRTIWMPQGSHANYDAEQTFDFPVGTVISKTFYYPRAAGGPEGTVLRTYDSSRDFAGTGLDLAHVHLVETRILVRRASGWAAIPYVWNAGQTEANLARTGAVLPLTLLDDAGAREAFNYVVPDESQCSSCHARDWVTRQIAPIGPKARHLNRDYDYADGRENQLAHLARVGYLQGLPVAAQIPRNANWMDTRQPLQARARAYLDINCGHCHNPKGAANTTALTLDVTVGNDRHLGICKPAVAAGRGTGDHMFDIVPGQPDASILPYRMASSEPGVMMPEIGRSTVHREGVALIRAWIASQQGACVARE